MKTGKNRSVLRPEEVTIVRCRAHTEAETDTPTLFCPEMNINLPEGLYIQEVLLTMKRRKSVTVPVSLVNTTEHSITLGPRVRLGHMEGVKLCTQPLYNL